MKARVKGTMGLRFYARLLRAMVHKAQTINALAEAVGSVANTVRQIVRRMAAQRLVHLEAWTQTAPGKQWESRWRAGEGIDAPPPVAHRTGITSQHGGATRKPIKPRAEMTSFAHLIRALETPITVAGLKDATGLEMNTLYRLLTFMRSIRLVHVADWEHSCLHSGVPTRLFRYAPDTVDAARPKPLTRRQIDARAYERRQAKAGARTLTRAWQAHASPAPVALKG